jgi:hypothetical protein
MFFVAWWRGQGLVILLITVVCAAIGLVGAEVIFGQERGFIGFSIGLVLSSIPAHYFVKHLQKKAGAKYDRRSGHVYVGRIGDSLFSINLGKWPRIPLFLGAGFLVLHFIKSTIA